MSVNMEPFSVRRSVNIGPVSIRISVNLGPFSIRMLVNLSPVSYKNVHELGPVIGPVLKIPVGCHGGVVATQSPPTSGVCGSNPGPYMGKLIVADRWSAVYSTEP